MRIMGLSTALANAKDLADWLGIEGQLLSDDSVLLFCSMMLPNANVFRSLADCGQLSPESSSSPCFFLVLCVQ